MPKVQEQDEIPRQGHVSCWKEEKVCLLRVFNVNWQSNNKENITSFLYGKFQYRK